MGDPRFNMYKAAPEYYDATLSPEFIAECYMPIRHAVEGLLASGCRSVLDLCCGTGVIAELLGDLDAVDYLGLDINEDFVAFSRRRLAGNAGFRFQAADLLSFQLEGTADIILMINAYHHFKNADKSAVLGKVRHWLSSGGAVIVYEMCIAENRSQEMFRRANIDYYEKRIDWIEKTETVTPEQRTAWQNARDLSASMEDEYKVDFTYITEDFKRGGFSIEHVDRIWPPPGVTLFEVPQVGEFLFQLRKGAPDD